MSGRIETVPGGSDYPGPADALDRYIYLESTATRFVLHVLRDSETIELALVVE